MSHLALFLLGPPRVERDGGEIQIPRHKATALLAYLALTRRSHRRDALATLLWPEHDQATARAYLRRALTALRNALGEGWLDADRETVGLDPGADPWLDVDAFHGPLAACRTHGHPPDEACPDCLPLLEEAAAFYRDDLLAGFTLPDSPAFDDWQFFQTQSLRDELGGVLERLAEGYAAQGAFEQAIAHARRWLALDPLHEPAHRALMRLYAWAGQRAAALHQYAECQRVLEEELGTSPEEETTRLYEDLQAHHELPPPTAQASQASPPAAARQHNLPAQLIPFVGREPLLDEIGMRLSNPGCRLLKLVGPGGGGKTRLALEAASRQLDAYPDGVWFVSLAPVESVEGIVPAIAHALGFAFHGERTPRDQLLAYLRHRQALLVLDNYEHLLPGAALAVDILTEAPLVKALVTSRARLGLQGEHLHPIEGMDVPSLTPSAMLTSSRYTARCSGRTGPIPSPPGKGANDALRYSAIKLFVSAAQRADPGFALTESNQEDVVRICQLVEGMPLAILLAAAWVGTLTPAEAADEVGQSLDFLEADWGDLPPRQRSMRAVFDHSWALLDERECALLAALSVYRGGFTRQAAGRVAGASLRDLTSLANRSLLHRLPDGRYEMHELLRQYAAEKLAADPETEGETQDRHCTYYAAALQRWDAELKGPRQLTALAEVEADIANARAAWDWAVEQRDVGCLDQAMDGLCRFYEWRGRYEEGESACRAAAKALPSSDRGEPAAHVAGQRALARILGWQSRLNMFLGYAETVHDLSRRSMALLGELERAGHDVRVERAFALWMAGMSGDWWGIDRGESRALLEDSLALYRALGARWETACVLTVLGGILQALGLYDHAAQAQREALTIHRQLGDPIGIAEALEGLGWVLMGQGDLAEAERLTREALALRLAMNDPYPSAEAESRLSAILVFQGRFAEAYSLREAVLAAANEMVVDPTRAAYAAASLGELELLLGRYAEARRRAQAGLDQVRDEDHGWQVGIILLCLGEAAMGEGAYAEARTRLQESLAQFQQVETRDQVRWAHAVLAGTALLQGDVSAAQGHLLEALRQRTGYRSSFAAVIVLPFVARLLADRGEVERAVELYALASRSPWVANAQWFEDMAGQYIAAAAEILPPEVVAAVQARGRARDLEATVQELLEELGEGSGEE